MLLNIYLGTTAISIVVTTTFSLACAKKLERKGYICIKEYKSFAEKIANFMSISFKLLLPIYNIVNAATILFMGDKLYEYAENEALEAGKIFMPEEKNTISNQEIKLTSVNEPVITHSDDIEKSYDKMTTEEKINYLKNEREKVLNRPIKKRKLYK